jgi:hypothetical protein
VTITVLANIAPPAPPPSPPRPMALTATTTAFSSSGVMPADAAVQHVDTRHAKHATRHAASKPPVRHAARHLPPKPEAADAAPAIDALDLLAVTDPILLPGFTVSGDEVAMLMLPAAPEITHMHDAYAKAVRRLSERTPSHITFVNPLTGDTDADDAVAAMRRAGHQPWLLVDTNEAVRPSRITWETA